MPVHRRVSRYSGQDFDELRAQRDQRRDVERRGNSAIQHVEPCGLIQFRHRASPHRDRLVGPPAISSRSVSALPYKLPPAPRYGFHMLRHSAASLSTRTLGGRRSACESDAGPLPRSRVGYTPLTPNSELAVSPAEVEARRATVAASEQALAAREDEYKRRSAIEKRERELATVRSGLRRIASSSTATGRGNS